MSRWLIFLAALALASVWREGAEDFAFDVTVISAGVLCGLEVWRIK